MGDILWDVAQTIDIDCMFLAPEKVLKVHRGQTCAHCPSRIFKIELL